MKKITLMLFVLVAFCLQSNAQVQVGDGTYTYAYNTYPFNPYYGYSYAQSIYLASEINASGDITSISFEMANADAIDNSDDMIDLWIGHTTKTEFDSTSDWVDVSTLTQVMTSGTLTKTGTTITFTFSSPFTYNGTDNLIIALDANEDGYEGSSDVLIGTDVGSNRTLRQMSDTVNADPTAPPTGTLTPYVGNITLNGINAVCVSAAATASIVEDCDNSEFSILVDVTDLGDSVNLEITNDAGVASTTVTATGEVTVGPFPVGTPVVLTLENENNDICDVVLDSILDFCPTAATTLDYYNLQYPATLTFPENEMTDQFVYAQAYEAGLTDTTTGGPAAGIEAWIGYSSDDTDPSTGTGWTWEVATFNVEVGNNDEYAVNMQALGLAEGTYYYASRFTLNAGPYMYGGILADGSNGGVWDGTTNISGVLTVEPHVAIPGDDCANPIVIGALPYNTTDDTANYTNEFDNGDSPCHSYYMSGNDAVYAYTPAADANINLSLSGLTAAWSAIHFLDGCPTDGATTCVGFVGGSDSADRSINGVDVIGGTTYYVVISTWATPNTVGYTLDITENSCSNATATYTVVSDCDNSGGFNIEVDITDMGTATEVSVTDDQGSAAQTTMVAATLTFGPYVNATDVIITIADENDVTCVQSSDALTQAACPPVNDDCTGAIALTPGGVFGDNPVDGTVAGATADAEPADCGLTGPGVWYSIVVPASGDITIEVGDDSLGGTGFDSVIEAFTGTCGALTSINCDDDGADTGAYSQLDLTGLTGGETIYVRVWEYNGDEIEPFSVSAYSATLSVDDFQNEAAFTYYPNPVKNTLTLNAQNTIEQVAMYNMLGQEVLRATPNTVASDLDMSNLQTGTYFVKVTIANVTKTIRVIKQ